MSLTERIRRSYAASGIAVQEKAVALFVVNAFLFFGFFALAVIRLMGGFYLMGGIELGMSLSLVVFLILLRRGYFRLISLVSQALFLLGATGLFAVREITSVMELYALPAYFIPASIASALLAFGVWQVAGVVILSILIQLSFYALRIVPFARAAGIGIELSEMMIAMILSVFSGIFTIQLYKMQHRSLSTMERQQKIAEKRLLDSRGLLEEAGTAFNVGERLSESASRNVSAAEEIQRELSSMQEQVADLTESAETMQCARRQIQHSKESVRSRMERQSSATKQTVGSTKEILTHVEEIRTEVESKDAVINELISVASESVKQVDQTTKQVGVIAESTTSILQVIGVIDDIAGRTNLLAMNASIQAAHAGEAGKGFAVVAGEIRKLSEETNRNSQAIRKTLEENARQIESAAGQSGRLKEMYGEVALKIASIKDAIHEISVRIGKLVNESDAISQAVENLTVVNDEVLDSLGGMEQELENSDECQRNTDLVIRTMADEIASLLNAAQRILAEAETVDTIGKENIESFSRIRRSMEELVKE